VAKILADTLETAKAERATIVLRDEGAATTGQETRIILRREGAAPADQRIQIVPDSRSNQLIVSASKEAMQEIETLIAEIDVSKANGKEIVLLQLKYSEAGELATILNLLLEDAEDAKVIADARRNWLIIQASAQDLSEIKDLVKQLDVQRSDQDTRPGDPNKWQPWQQTHRSTTADMAILLAEIRRQAADLQAERKQLYQELQVLYKELITSEEEHIDIGRDERPDANSKSEDVARLLAQLTELETQRIQLENRLKSFKAAGAKGIASEETLKARQEYVNNDPVIKAMAEDIAELELELLAAKQTMAENHPTVRKKAELLKVLKERLRERKDELHRTFDSIAKDADGLDVQLDQLNADEQRVRQRLEEHISQIVALEQKRLKVQELQDKLAQVQESYSRVCERIEQLKVQRENSRLAPPND
jgi:hypothetical protein